MFRPDFSSTQIEQFYKMSKYFTQYLFCFFFFFPYRCHNCEYDTSLSFFAGPRSCKEVSVR